jgi:hypothetical protein
MSVAAPQRVLARQRSSCIRISAASISCALSCTWPRAEDAVGFDQLIGDLKLPLAGKCWWAHEMLRTAAELDAPLVTECWLREDMSWYERRLYLLVLSWYNPTALTFEERDGHVFVAPGPFLETLKAYDLVHCESRPSHVLFLRPIVSKPFRFCLGEVPR